MKKVIAICALCFFLLTSGLPRPHRRIETFDLKDVSVDMQKLNEKLENIDSLFNRIK